MLGELINAAQAVSDVVADLDPRAIDPGVADARADDAAVGSLLRAGFGVASEESGRTAWDRPVRVVVDPVDGSNNLQRGIPHVATSLWAFDFEGGVAAVVRFLPGGRTFHATRSGGAFVDGLRLQVRPTDPGDELLVAGPSSADHGIWSRRLGASAVELCLLASGSLDGFATPDGEALPAWDYLAGLMIAVEAGCVVSDLDGADVWDPDIDVWRRPIAATSIEALDRLRLVADLERGARRRAPTTEPLEGLRDQP